MSDHYLVVGNPIAHSRSPAIHMMFAEQTGQDIKYDYKLLDVENFEESVLAFLAQGGEGLNITMPFKGQAWALAEKCSEDAKCARAVNTLYKDDDGTLCGTTTDGVGLLVDIEQNLGWQIEGAKVLVLGAGGATRGVLRPLLAAKPAELALYNRTQEKAKQLRDDFAQYGSIEVVSDAGDRSFDIVINATSTSLSNQLPAISPGVFKGGARAYDMVYSAEPTGFMIWALDNGAAEAVDGLGMLVEQAAASFEIWRGVQPETSSVISELRKQMEAELAS